MDFGEFAALWGHNWSPCTSAEQRELIAFPGSPQCPFAHPGEKAKRRDPRKMNYSGTACPDFRKVAHLFGMAPACATLRAS